MELTFQITFAIGQNELKRTEITCEEFTEKVFGSKDRKCQDNKGGRNIEKKSDISS